MISAEDLSCAPQKAEAKIRYDVSLKDMAMYSGFHFARSAEGKRRINRLRPIFSLVGGLVGFCIGLLFQRIYLYSWNNILAVLSALLGVILPYVQFWQMANDPKFFKKRVTKMYGKGYEKTLLCEHELIVSESGFIDRTTYHEGKFSWGSLHHIESEPDFTYLYVGPKNAIVIPHKNIIEGDLPSLLTAIKTHYKSDQLLEPAKIADI